MRRAVGLAVSAAVVPLVLAGCSGESDDPSRTSSASPRETTSGEDAPAGLTYTRDDGSTFVLTDFGVTCRRSSVDDRTRIVKLSSPSAQPVASTKPFFYAEVVPGTTGDIELPVAAGSERRAGPVLFFTYDPEDQNQLAANLDEATGTVTILEASCDPEPRLSLRIDGTLGSEYGDLPELDVVGSAEAGPAGAGS